MSVKYAVVALGVALVAIGLLVFTHENQAESPAAEKGEAQAINPLNSGPCSQSKNWLQLYGGPSPLAAFSETYNATMLWGSYQPQLYFGLRTRSQPDFVSTALLWRTKGGPWRYEAEEGEGSPSKWGWTMHDGRHFGTQTIKDSAMTMTTSFIKDNRQGWTAVVEASGYTDELDLVFYVAAGSEESASSSSSSSIRFDARKHMLGTTESLGDFEVSFHSDVKFKTGVRQCADLSTVRESILKKKPKKQLGGVHVGAARLHFGKGSDNARLQVHFKTSKATEDTVVEEDLEKLTVAYDNELTLHQTRFETRFQEVFGLSSFKPVELEAAHFALSNLIGAMGYFHGRVEIEGAEALSPRSSLFTAVPSRAFFPRGFLWDEGFHLSVIRRWDPVLALDSIGHWLGALRQCRAGSDAGGWIPREQILGKLAAQKVPDWAIPQSVSVANPPTLLLPLVEAQRQLLSGQWSSDVDAAVFFESASVRAEAWVRWLAHRLVRAPGPVLGTAQTTRYYRWSDRRAEETRLHPNTLSSGLDDYPRASSVDVNTEAHVDAACWVGWAYRQLAALAHPDSREAARFTAEYESIRRDALEQGMHWNPETGGFYDVGTHSEEGTFEDLVVYRCATRDDKEGKDIGVPLQVLQKQQNPCPPDFPLPKWPLGDGQGGLLMRPTYREGTDKRYRTVPRRGYVSVFPLLLGVLQSPQHILAQLQFLTQELVGDSGLRSLARSDAFYQRENAPGDAPYWRGPVWMPMNYLALKELYALQTHDNAAVKEQASHAYSLLRRAVLGTVLGQYERTGWLWEQYNDETGRGQKSRPFTGWTATVLLVMAEQY